MGTLPSCSCVSTIVWQHHLNFNEVTVEKAKWKQHKDAMWCFEEILEAILIKQQLCLPSCKQDKQKHAGLCWRSRNEVISKVLQKAPMHGHTSVG